MDAFFNRQLAKKRELSLAFTLRESAKSGSKTSVTHHTVRREREELFFQKKKNRKKKAHTLEFLLHKQTNNYSRVPSVYKERRYIYREIERERERLFLSLRFDFSSRNTERDERQISYFFFFSEPPPPRKNKRKSASRRRRRRRRARREKALFWGIKNDVGRGRSAAAEIRLEGV